MLKTTGSDNMRCVKELNATGSDNMRCVKELNTIEEHTHSELALRLIDLVSGCYAGAAQVMVAQPFDTVKVKQQTFPKRYKSMIDCFVTTFKNEGFVHGLYSGTLPALAANIGENSVLFAAYGGCRNFVARLMGIENQEDLPLYGEAISGSMGSFFTSFILCPTELVKCKLQAINEIRLLSSPPEKSFHYMTMGELIRQVYTTDGIKGFYRGLGSTLVREMPGYFFFFGSYEGIRDYFTEPGQHRDDVGPLITILAGAVAGIMLWTVTFPADVIKSRIQIKNLDMGMLAVGAKIVRNDGFGALYSGLLPSVIRTIPSTATLFMVYEYSKRTLKEMF